MDVESVGRLLLWGLGLSFTGFIVLVSLVIRLNIEMSKRVTYEWIETRFEGKILDEIKEVKELAMEIKKIIHGDLKVSGIIDDVRTLQRDFNELKREHKDTINNCNTSKN